MLKVGIVGERCSVSGSFFIGCPARWDHPKHDRSADLVRRPTTVRGGCCDLPFWALLALARSCLPGLQPVLLVQVPQKFAPSGLMS
jgi:hypothetical protein